MTVTLTGYLRSKFEWLYKSTDDLGDTQEDEEKSITKTLTSGQGADACELMYRERRTLTLATGTDLLDLAGSLTDRFGDTLTFTKVKALLIHNLGEPDGSGGWDEVAGQDLLVGGAGAGGNGWGAPFDGDQDAEVRVRAGGWLVLVAPADGYSVAAGSEDILQIVHDGSVASGGDIEYDIVLMGY